MGLQIHEERRKLSEQAGFSLVELLIVVAIIGLLASVAIPALNQALLRSQVASLANDAKVLHSAFIRFNIDNSLYPSTHTPPERAFNRSTLEPLVSRGYLKSGTPILRHLLNHQVTSYDSPNIESADTQFWAVLTLASYPSVQMLGNGPRDSHAVIR